MKLESILTYSILFFISSLFAQEDDQFVRNLRVAFQNPELVKQLDLSKQEEIQLPDSMNRFIHLE